MSPRVFWGLFGFHRPLCALWKRCGQKDQEGTLSEALDVVDVWRISELVFVFNWVCRQRKR